MNCPNCRQSMAKRELGSVVVDHCDFCGGTFFDVYEINRISSKAALALSRQMKSQSISGGAKLCPIDQIELHPLEQDSVPENTTLLKCNDCGGIFAYPDDLVRFKDAQAAKVNTLSSWFQPAPAVSKVFAMSFVFAVASAVFYGSFVSQNATLTRATDDLCTPSVIASADTTTIYCATEYEFGSSKAVFRNTLTGEAIERLINDAASKTHVLTVNTADIAPLEDACVELVLTNSATTLTTECVPLVSE